MGRFVCFHEDSYRIIRNLYEKKVISETLYLQLSECRNVTDIQKAFRGQKQFDWLLTAKIWMYIVSEVWEGRHGSFKDSTYFSEPHCSFMKKLIENNGVYLREDCQRDILTDQQIIRKIRELEEIDVIISLRTKRTYGNKIVFLLNPQIIEIVDSKKEGVENNEEIES